MSFLLTFTDFLRTGYIVLASLLTSYLLQAVGGAALTAGDGGAAYIWDVRAMQLGGALQVS